MTAVPPFSRAHNVGSYIASTSTGGTVYVPDVHVTDAVGANVPGGHVNVTVPAGDTGTSTAPIPDNVTLPEFVTFTEYVNV